MSCKLDHSREDVIQKLGDHKHHLPEEVAAALEQFLNNQEHPQELLNEVFHLLKKIDLIAEDEREARIQTLQRLVNSTKQL